MKILVIDREPVAAQLVAGKLAAKGHDVAVESQKQQALDRIHQEQIECVLLDPAPLSDARPVIVGMWKSSRAPLKPYIMLFSKDGTKEAAVAAGANDILFKPLDAAELDTKIDNAQRIVTLVNKLSGEEDLHSGGGIIGKNAFQQLFLSAIDRAFRYAERSFVTFITMDPDNTIPENELSEKIDTLSKDIIFMRRQSDVIGRVGRKEYALLMQRPMYESEPADAVGRFAEFLTAFAAKNQGYGSFSIDLIELPSGQLHQARTVKA